MRPAVHHDPTHESRDARIAWFVSLSFEDRFRQAVDTLTFLTEAGVRKPAWDEEKHDTKESFRVARRPRPA